MAGNIIAGRYRVDSLIGTGGMANVYKAYDLQKKRTVAIKMLKDEHREDQEFLRRFEREAKAVLTLSHPNIVQSYDVGRDSDGANFIVLEYLEGSTLKEYIKVKGSLSVKETVSIASKVLDALEHAHDCGIIHRDVKPQNVIITKSGTVKLTDFGIARDASSTTRTFAGASVLGSVHYISPEQARGEDVTAESDLYSCAIMIYEMLTGAVPFSGENTVAIALKHLQEEMIPPIEINPKVYHALSDVVMKGAAKDPLQRYHTAGEMKRDLVRALREPHGKFARLTKPREDQHPERRANRTLLISAVAIFGGIAIFAIVSFASDLLNGSANLTDSFLVPSLIGKPLDEARSLAELRGFDLSVSDYVISSEYPAGQVTNQIPLEGAKGAEGDTVTVEVSSGSGYAIVPDLVGSTMQEASLLLAEESLNIGNVGYDPSSELPSGEVISQEPASDTRVSEFESVDVWISGTGSGQVGMPPLIGLSTEVAMDLIKDSGLTQIWIRPMAAEDGTAEETVLQQSPAANMSTGKDILAEVWISRTDPGNFSADIAVNIDIEDAEKIVTVTAVMDNGMQMVLYENKMQPGLQQPVVFTGYLREAGERECVVYANGTEIKRVKVNFEKR